MPLFVNDSANGGKDFQIQYASSMNALQIHGELSYLYGEQFQATASVNINQYTNIKKQPECVGAVAGGIEGQSEMGGVQGVLG